MAAALVAGSAALVRQYFREGFHIAGVKNPAQGIAPSAALLRASLLSSAHGTPLSGEEAAAAAGRVTLAQGYGHVQLDNVLRFHEEEEERRWDLHVVDGLQMEEGGTWEVCVRVRHASTRPLRVTLAWTDAPAASATFKALVNDLDLVVTAPQGGEALGNGRAAYDEVNGLYAVRDSENNNEQVHISQPLAGEHRITVTAADLPLPPQSFALVVTGQFEVQEACSSAPAPCGAGCARSTPCVDGRCECGLERWGHRCDQEVLELARGAAHTLRISSGSWSFFRWEGKPGEDGWEVELQAEDASMDPDLYLGRNAVPSMKSFVAYDRSPPTTRAVVLNNQRQHLRAGGQAVWVLGVYAFCCRDVSAVIRLDDRVWGPPLPANDWEIETVQFRLVITLPLEQLIQYSQDYVRAVAPVLGVDYNRVSLTISSWDSELDRTQIVRMSVQCLRGTSLSVAERVDEAALNAEIRQRNLKPIAMYEAATITTKSKPPSGDNNSPPVVGSKGGGSTVEQWLIPFVSAMAGCSAFLGCFLCIKARASRRPLRHLLFEWESDDDGDSTAPLYPPPPATAPDSQGIEMQPVRALPISAEGLGASSQDLDDIPHEQREDRKSVV